MSRRYLGTRQPEICAFVGIAVRSNHTKKCTVTLAFVNGGERHTMRMVGGGKRAESTCLRKTRRILVEYVLAVAANELAP